MQAAEAPASPKLHHDICGQPWPAKSMKVSMLSKKIMKSQHQYWAITVKKCLNLNFGISMKFPNFDFHILEIMKKTLGQNEIPKFESQNMILANTLNF